MGSRSLGVMKWSVFSRAFTNIVSAEVGGLSNDNVWSIMAEGNTLWVGTEKGLNHVDLEQNTIDSIVMSIEGESIVPTNYVYALFPNDEQSLWAYTMAGLRLFDKQSRQYKKGKLSETAIADPYSERAWGHIAITKGQLYFITMDGFFVYNQNTGDVKPLLSLNEQVDVESAISFAPSFRERSKTILLRLVGSLVEINLDTFEVRDIYKLKRSRPSAYQTVGSHVVDLNNVLWLAVDEEGIVGLDADSLRELYRFDMSNGLNTNYVYSLTTDNRNNLWASSQNGLYKIEAERKSVTRFESKDGFVSSEFNGGAFAKLNENQIAFGSPRGVTIVDPLKVENIISNNQELAVHVTSVNLISEPNLIFSDYDNIELDYDQHGLKLVFSTLSFVKQGAIKLDIKIEGRNDLLLNKVNANELIIPKLSAGNYVIKVNALNPVTGRGIEPASINIKVKSVPWASNTAIAIYVFLTLTIVGATLFSRYRRNQERAKAHRQLQASENQMQLALQSSSSGIWDYRIELDTLYEARLAGELGHSDLKGGVSISKRMALMHPDDLSILRPQWQAFVEGRRKSWDVSYRLKDTNEKWLWYREVGKVIKFDENNKPLRLIGTYTNITKSKASELRAQLFGEAFSQINDWVLILDRDKEPITANDAFLKAFQLTDVSSQLGLKLVLNKLQGQKMDEFNEIIRALPPKGTWQGEEVIETAENERHPVLIKVNAIDNGAGDISHYVVVISDITVQKQAEEKLRHLAHYDFLTDLPNRKLVLEKIEQKAMLEKDKFALFFIDLDKFKQVNDLYGHLVGDKLLKHVANILTDLVSLHDLVARQSGDEFILLVEDYQSLDDLGHLAERINVELSKTLEVD